MFNKKDTRIYCERRDVEDINETFPRSSREFRALNRNDPAEFQRFLNRVFAYNK